GALALEIPFGEGLFGGRGVELSADGTFRVAGLQTGRRYELFLRAPKAGPLGGAAQRSSVVEARAGDRGVTLGYSEGASVRFLLVDGSGAPVTRAEVSAGLERPRLRIREGDPLPEGAVEVRGLFPKAGGQPLQVSVRAPGKAPWNAEGLRLAPEEQLDLGRVTLLDRGQVRVTVRSAAGDAVEGAEVRLVAAATANPGGSRVIRRSMRLSGDLASPEGLEGLLNGEGPGAVGRTDGAGICTLDADAGSRVDVRVTHPEHAPSRSGPVEVLAVGQVTEHEVRLAAPGWVEVSVVDALGNPVPDALVESRQSGRRRSGSAPVRTDASGRVQVGPFAAGTARFRLGEEWGPRVAISLSVEADAAGGDGWSEVEVTAGEVATLTLVAPNRVVVTGVVTEGGLPLAGATVVLEARGDGGVGLGFLGLGSDGPTADTDGRGAFRLDDVEVGEYALKVRHPDRAMEEAFDVEVEAIDTRFEVDLAVTVIEGRVTASSGDPVVDAEVTARRKRPSGGPAAMIAISSSDGGPQVLSFGGLGGRAVRTDADGRYRLRGVVPGVALIVTASEPSLGSTESEPLEVEAGSLTVDVDLTFVQPGQVTLRVEGLQADALSRPLALARLDGSGQPTAEFVRDGVASFKGLEPGAYTFSIVGLGEEVTVEPESVDLDVGAGDDLEATFTVRR
ncbi:MAG: carboxypeptidase-like regulatory domain-containing protein, partial [Planctomycetota bacterium]